MAYYSRQWRPIASRLVLQLFNERAELFLSVSIIKNATEKKFTLDIFNLVFYHYFFFFVKTSEFESRSSGRSKTRRIAIFLKLFTFINE